MLESSKDVRLNAKNSKQLNGRFSNSFIGATINYNKPLLTSTHPSSKIEESKYIVDIEIFDKKTLDIKLYSKDSLIKTSRIVGKFRGGYFRVKPEREHKFIAGPLLWILRNTGGYSVGLSEKNNLVIVESGGIGILFITIMPVFAAGSADTLTEYLRLK
jgi:hypothetical protein